MAQQGYANLRMMLAIAAISIVAFVAVTEGMNGDVVRIAIGAITALGLGEAYLQQRAADKVKPESTIIIPREAIERAARDEGTAEGG